MVEVTTEDILNALRRGKPQPPAMPAMEGANIGLANLGKGIKSTVEDIYGRMKQGVTQGAGSSKSEFDPSIGLLAPELMLPAFGRATGGVGAFGGKLKLPPNPIAENMSWLQSQKPVDKQWVKDWAKDADVNITNIKEGSNVKGKKSSTYIDLEPPSPPLNRRQVPRVRIPEDPMGHIGYPQGDRAGSYVDTGRSVVYTQHMNNLPMDPNKKLLSRPTDNPEVVMAPKFMPNEKNLMNQAGDLYSHPEALDAWLKWRLSKAPTPARYGQPGNWLIPEEMAPRLPIKETQETLKKARSDPNQLKLLSSGFTPAQMLEILKKQQENAQ